MNIELRNVKHAAFASEETNCFSADIWIDGKKAGDARNDGHGGCTMISPRACHDTIKTFTDTLPPEVTEYKDPQDPSKPFVYHVGPDAYVDALLETFLVARDLKRALSKRVLFTKPGESNIYQTKSVPAAIVARWTADPKTAATLGAEKVLNALPFDEALALYRAAA